MKQAEIYAGFAAPIYLTLLFLLSLSSLDDRGLAGDDWKTGAAFRTALNKKLRIQSTGTLQEDLESLSRNTGVAIYLDRDIDPSREVRFPEATQPLGKTLDDIAKQVNGLAVHVGSFVYIAPRDKAVRFMLFRNAQAFQVSRLPLAIRNKLEKVSEFGWKFLSTPRDWIKVLASNCGLSISNSESIPHDLWPERQLPRLSNWEQLTFSLGCMNRSFVIDGATLAIKILEVDPDQVVTLRFRKSDSRKIEKLLADNQLDDVQKVVRGNDFFVRGKLDACLILIDKNRAPRKWKTQIKAGSKDVFDLNTNASRGSILATIARNRNVKLSFAPALTATLNEKITVNVKKATMEQLLSETLQGTGLKYRLTDSLLIITK